MTQKIKDIPRLTNKFLEALIELPVPLQLSFLRRSYGISQLKLSEQLKMKQAYVSRLEKEGTNHLLKHYESLAKLLHCRLALIPKGAKIIPR